MNSFGLPFFQFYRKNISHACRVPSLRWLSLLGFLALAFTPNKGICAGPSFVGSTTAFSVNQDANATSIKSLLVVSDTDTGKTLTWSQSTAPAHGTLTFTSATASSGSTSITPGGTITYTPTALYNGSDTFSVKVSDGSLTATETISVTVDCISTGSNLSGVSARPGQIGTYWVETRGTGFGWITNNIESLGGIPLRGYFQYRVGTGAWQTLGKYTSGSSGPNTAPSGATIRYVDTNATDSTTSQSIFIGWNTGANYNTTGMSITPAPAPSGITQDAWAIWDIDADGDWVTDLSPAAGLSGGLFVLDSQSNPNLLAVSGTTLVLGTGTMPADGQTVTATLTYYDPLQLDCNGDPITNNPTLGAPAVQTLSFTIRNSTPAPKAEYVLGQPNFLTNAANVGANGLSGPAAVAIDVSHGKAYVADSGNNRILRYAWPVTGNQPNAQVVFGQTDFVGNGTGCSQTAMSYPSGLSVDSSGNLWVADYSNNRVLRFSAAYQVATNNAAASLVLGQASFTASASATTASGMTTPSSLRMDAAANLWVADTGNNRVLRFASANSIASGASANGVLGQSSFAGNTAATTQSGLTGPLDLTSSGTTLFVSDSGNNRVLRFANAASKANGGTADGVLGQLDFTNYVAQTTQDGLSEPYGLCADAAGGLYVADMDNDRVLVYSNAVSKANGGNADAVIGTTSFTDTNLPGPVTQSLLYYPAGLGYDTNAGVLAMADSYNNRTLVYSPPLLGTTCTVSGSPNPSTYGESVTFTATVTRSSGSSTPSGTVTFSEGGTTLGSGTLSGSGASATATYSTTNLPTGNNTIVAAYSGDANFNASSGTNSPAQTVNKATPTVTTWPTATAITYGQTLANSTLSGGSATPAGSFAWTTSSTAPGAGTASQSVTFTPTDTTDYTTVTGTSSVTVNKATPTVTTWPAATAITYGQTLASSTLTGGSATTTGSFAWTTPSTEPGAGTASQSITFTPTDTTDYTTVTGTSSVTVNKATPTVTTWPTASAITYGQTLANSTLTGGSTTPAGSFAWTTSSTAPGAGTVSQSVTFTPTDTTDYTTVIGTASVTVNQATPTVTTWPTASAITYGQTLASSTLTGGSTTPAGSFTWTTSSTTPGAGTASQSVTFTPTDTTDYTTVTGTASVTVNQATPTVTTWPTASAITYGQTLASSTLTGGSTTPAGSFAWTTSSTAPGVGATSQSVTFTPTDTTDYTTVIGTVSVTVDPGTVDVVLDTNSLNQTYDGTAKSVVVLSPTNLVVELTYDGSDNAPTNAGSYTVVGAVIDTNYVGSVTNTLVIEAASQTINFAALPSFVVGDAPYTLSATASSGLPVTFASSDNTIASISGNTLTIVGVGTATVTAAQAGDGANYLAATNISEPAVVSPVIADLAINLDTNGGFYTVTNVVYCTNDATYYTNVQDVYTNVTLTIMGNQGRAYDLLFENDLTQTNWQTLFSTTNLPSSSYQIVYPATNWANYYRLRHPLPTP
jgi:hypothetical protein